MGDNLYTDYWQTKMPEIIEQLQRGEVDFTIDVAGIKNSGSRESYYSNFKIVKGTLEDAHNAQAHGRDFYSILSGTDYFKNNLRKSIIQVVISTDNKMHMVLVNDTDDSGEFIQQSDIDSIKRVVNDEYDTNTPEKANFENVRNSLNSFIGYCSNRLGIKLTICRSEKFNKQAGQGASANNWSDYILVGVFPYDLNCEKSLFIKFAIYELSGDTGFHVQLDCDYTSQKYKVPENVRTLVLQLQPLVDQRFSIGELYSKTRKQVFELIRDGLLRNIELYKQPYELFTGKKAPLPTRQNTTKVNLMQNNSLNQILYGPPGTGKTYKLQKEYLPSFLDKSEGADLDRIVWLKEIVKNVPWWKIIAAILYESKVPLDVSTIAENELIKAKHTVISTSKTVYIRNELLAFGDRSSSGLMDKYRGKYELFKKEVDLKWSLIDKKAIETILPEVIELISQSEKPNSGSSVENKRYTFITFHQSYAYEDFIIGIKPKISTELDDSIDGALKYIYSEGVFYSACLEALKLAGFDSFAQYEATPILERKEKFKAIKGDVSKSYAVFIDEINRGNIAAIFGELITLIEEDKRLGADSELLAELPYTQEYFGVPANLYLIGTMNTADRSVEALDTALRRRFSFEYMAPLPGKLKETEDGINLSQLLTKVNERITILKDADHTIGHAWLWNVTNLDKLKAVFANNILPLLREHFYNDYEKLGLVLGDRFFESPIQVKSDSFAKFSNGGSLAGQYEQSLIYRLKKVESLTKEDFISLYNNS